MFNLLKFKAVGNYNAFYMVNICSHDYGGLTSLDVFKLTGKNQYKINQFTNKTYPRFYNK